MESNKDLIDLPYTYNLVFIFTRSNKSVISQAIRFLERGQWSHVAVLLVSADQQIVLEAREGRGVICTKWDEYRLDSDFASITFEIGSSQFQRVKNKLMSYVDSTKYDYLGVSSFLLPLRKWLYPKNWDARLYCSEFAMVALSVIFKVSPSLFTGPNRLMSNLSFGYLFLTKGFLLTMDENANTTTTDATNAAAATQDANSVLAAEEFQPILAVIEADTNLDVDELKRQIAQDPELMESIKEFEAEVNPEAGERGLNINFKAMFVAAKKMLLKFTIQQIPEITEAYVKPFLGAELTELVDVIADAKLEQALESYAAQNNAPGKAVATESQADEVPVAEPVEETTAESEATAEDQTDEATESVDQGTEPVGEGANQA